MPPEPLAGRDAFSLISGRKRSPARCIGGIAETQEMLDFCAEHGIVADVEVIRADQINEAYERMLRRRRALPVRHRHLDAGLRPRRHHAAMRRTLLAAAVITALSIGLDACSVSRPSPGVLTGWAFGCAGFSHPGPVKVVVYTSLYVGRWQAALTRVDELGADSGEPVAATRVIAGGTDFRVELAPGRYVVGVGQDARLLTVSSGRTTTVDFPRECFGVA